MLDKPLFDLLTPSVAALGYELVGVERISQGKRGLIVRVYIDKTNGVTLEDCERVSYQLSGLLEVEDPIQSAYDLEVSSPGWDRPLFLLAHYQAQIGHKVRLRLRRAQQQRRSFSGLLRAVNMDTETLHLEIDGELFDLNYADVERAHVVPDENELRKRLNKDKNR